MANSGNTTRGKITKEKLLSDFRHLVTIHGIMNTSLDRLSEYSQTAKSSILWHFGSKEGLVIELVDSLFFEVEESVREGLANGADPFSCLFDKFTEFFLETPEANGVFFTLILNEPADSKVRKRVFDMYRSFRKKLSDHLNLGKPNSKPSILKASLLIALFDGLYLQWHLDPLEVPLKETLFLAQEMLAKFYGIKRSKEIKPTKPKKK
ncbi:TetR/AcrR family transcriptional regulator [Leptospira sp. 201903070]|uniref:TetR/AcrR family transcriptional regulator n=1 Tax=Leptospira ainlahdjerensis TaxID=2810033 RepID=A0ABS2U5T7_9LEPT|nr:TetR/AcrR family transcriptional regulator [Leptospira ainlahdjerensis]MBM9575741.1 TetR/AcrR family transcriptional regulator [Leptospira ainlahdjerensis]